MVLLQVGWRGCHHGDLLPLGYLDQRLALVCAGVAGWREVQWVVLEGLGALRGATGAVQLRLHLH